MDPAGLKPTTEDIIARSHAVPRVPLEIVKQHPDGAIFDSEATVRPRDPGNDARLELAAPLVLAELATVGAAVPVDDPAYPFRLVSRRLNRVLNSFGRRIPELAGDGRNPAYMHPDDMADSGFGEVAATIRSPHGEIEGHVRSEPALRRGVISMAHGFGAAPGKDDAAHLGGNTGRLLSNEVEFDPITGLPRMSAVPVQVTTLPAAEGV